jgi:hypothetical protein
VHEGRIGAFGYVISVADLEQLLGYFGGVAVHDERELVLRRHLGSSWLRWLAANLRFRNGFADLLVRVATHVVSMQRGFPARGEVRDRRRSTGSAPMP